MTASVFVDTNILVYAHDADAGRKKQRAATILKTLWEEGSGCLSTQVLQEFYVNATQKIKTPVARSITREILRNYAVWVHAPITAGDVVRASQIGESFQLSFWDSLILVAAEQSGARVVLSEDLNSGQMIAGIRVVNPFVEKTWEVG